MNDPLVTTWTDEHGVQHWGSVDVAPAKPATAQPSPVKPAAPKAEEVRADAAAVPANGDGTNPKPAKR